MEARPGDRRSRLIRRNIVRYIVLAYCIALRTVSFRLKKRSNIIEIIVFIHSDCSLKKQGGKIFFSKYRFLSKISRESIGFQYVQF